MGFHGGRRTAARRQHRVTSTLFPGAVVHVLLDPVEGRQQGGRRPGIVVSSAGGLETMTTLVSLVPVTSTDRGWRNHVPVRGVTTGLTEPSFAMTEQVRTVSRSRIRAVVGSVDPECLITIRGWIHDFLFD